MDGSGAAYVTGFTFSSDFPTTPGAFDTSLGDSDAFVNWTMRNREVDGYSELMAESISRQGTMPTGDADDVDPPECPQCSGPGVLPGTLGSTDHYRCRNCGWEFTS